MIEERVCYCLGKCKRRLFHMRNKNYNVGVDIFSRQGMQIEIKHVERNYMTKNCRL
jgi:hypothetical protein